MKTYEDLLSMTSEEDRQNFIKSAIGNYKGSELYRHAVIGYDYYRRRNTTITFYRKLLYTLSGNAVPDNYSANYKFTNNFFQLFTKQEASHLLGNGVTFSNESTKEKLGGDQFDNQLFRAGIKALWGTVSYSFYNVDHIDVFTSLEFVPLFGEEDGALHAGIRFWQIAPNKPMRVTLYEEDGYTDYRFDSESVEIVNSKRAYKKTVNKTEAGEQVVAFSNYPSFPVVPLWANEEHQSELTGLREKIDGYDLIQSGFANDVDDASQIYWTISNAGGMDDIDLAKFIEHMKIVGAATVDDQSQVQSHTIDVPYEARTQILSNLKDSLYRDAMALDTDKITAGNITATAINAGYENLTFKCDAFEMCVNDYIQGLFVLAGITDDAPVFKRSKIVNMAEETTMVLSAAQFLDNRTILKHRPFLSPDEIESILERMEAEEAERYEQTEINEEEDNG